MKTNQQYRFSRGNSGYVTFDEKGYVVEAKGFSGLIWTSSLNADKEIVGMHVDELAELLRKQEAIQNLYIEFELRVHIPLLKEMLKNRRKSSEKNNT